MASPRIPSPPLDSQMEAAEPPARPALPSARSAPCQRELAAGERFAFGENWRNFSRHLTAARIREAERSLQQVLERSDLRGCSFLDLGAGSGLFSLAAARLNAARIVSVDYDPQCLACCREVRRRFAGDLPHWTVRQGDARSREQMAELGQFDIVYSWGVLHQTGDMWRSLDVVTGNVAPGGRLVISIYNHQPLWTPLWTRVKRRYNRSPRPVRWCLALSYLLVKTPVLGCRAFLLGGRNGGGHGRRPGNRGMSRWHDAVDWVGGYPFETASPEAVFRFFRDRHFQLRDLSTVGGGSGCNEFVFLRPRNEHENPLID